MPKSIGMADTPMKQPVMAKADKSKMKRMIRSVEVETVSNGFEIECRFKQPMLKAPYIESTKHVFIDAKEASKECHPSRRRVSTAAGTSPDQPSERH